MKSGFIELASCKQLWLVANQHAYENFGVEPGVFGVEAFTPPTEPCKTICIIIKVSHNYNTHFKGFCMGFEHLCMYCGC